MEIAINVIVIIGILGIPPLLAWFLHYVYEADTSVCVHCVHCIDYEEPLIKGECFYECDIKGKMHPQEQCGRFRRVMPWRRRHE